MKLANTNRKYYLVSHFVRELLGLDQKPKQDLERTS